MHATWSRVTASNNVRNLERQRNVSSALTGHPRKGLVEPVGELSHPQVQLSANRETISTIFIVFGMTLTNEHAVSRQPLKH